MAARLAWVPENPVRWKADEAVSRDAVRLAPALYPPVFHCMYLAHCIGAVLVRADRLFVTALAPTGQGKAVVTLDGYASTR